MKFKMLLAATTGACLLSTAAFATAAPTPLPASCSGLPTHDQLAAQLKAAVGVAGNGGLGFNMWATVVGNDGAVCAVAFSGNAYTDQWLASRVISAQKAATANSLSLATVTGASSAGNLALASGNLYSADREGGSLFGLQFSNPVDPLDAYHQAGQPGTTPDPTTFGTTSDPMLGLPIGGINVFGGGLALYNAAGQKVGGLGVSGDTSCTDHYVAWRTRNGLKLDYLKTGHIAGPASLFAGDATHPDNLIFDIPNNTQKVGPGHAPIEGNNAISPSGFGHPQCLNQPTGALPVVE
ncbi:heme-binding protein [Methylocystis bryophila]|uniref:Heme-binding protein n=1 Tax=Methylocystis bryophila TaxID=655015 RepID=A0A1W6MXB2_9HYPH|nr:heme-binding protein [Methylocystis bryophila]ARN82215.1 hypothetical protein B1812_15230 [Methylocystis bryophila]